eukprot:Pgem_evm1s5344
MQPYAHYNTYTTQVTTESNTWENGLPDSSVVKSKLPECSTPNGDKLILYTDSSMADLPGAKTTIGYFTLYNNTVVDWKARQTNNIAIQQNEAEFIAHDRISRGTIHQQHPIIAPEPTPTTSSTGSAQQIIYNNIQSLLPNQHQQLPVRAHIDNCGAQQIIQGRAPIKNI